MKLIPINTAKDFAASYFARIFWDENTGLDRDNNLWREEVAEYFSIPKSKIRSIKKINNEIRRDLFINFKTKEEAAEFLRLVDNFKPIPKETIDNILEYLAKYLDKYLDLLDNIFTYSSIPKTINISFVRSIKINYYSAFMMSFKDINKVYIFISDTEIGRKELLAYSKAILHELTHLYIDNNQEFYSSLKAFYFKNYKDKIPASVFRRGVEEQVVTALVNSNWDFGYSYKYLNIPNNIEHEEEVLRNKSFVYSTYKFLNNLKSSKEENKISKYLSEFVEDLVKKGYWKGLSSK